MARIRTGLDYSASALANGLILRSMRGGKSIDQMQAQKLLFLVVGRALADFDVLLINEPVRAWRYGPVFPSLFQELRSFGDRPVTRPLFLAGDKNFIIPCVPEKDSLTHGLMDRVWSVFGSRKATVLSELTHVESSPWFQARARAKVGPDDDSSVEIPWNLIQDYFRRNFRC